MTRKDPARRHYFQVLLAHLAQSGLRQHQDGKTATIAVHTLLIRPYEQLAISSMSGQGKGEIQIESEYLDRFVVSPEGHEASTLIALGVDVEMIEPVARVEEHKKRTHGKYFIPDSSPLDALEVLRQISSVKAVAREGGAASDYAP